MVLGPTALSAPWWGGEASDAVSALSFQAILPCISNVGYFQSVMGPQDVNLSVVKEQLYLDLWFDMNIYIVKRINPGILLNKTNENNFI